MFGLLILVRVPRTAITMYCRGAVLRRKYLILQVCFLGLLLLLPAPQVAAQTYNDGMQAFQAGQFTKSRDIWEALATAGNPLLTGCGVGDLTPARCRSGRRTGERGSRPARCRGFCGGCSSVG